MHTITLPVADDNPDILDTTEIEIDPGDINNIKTLDEGLLLISLDNGETYRVYRQDLSVESEATIDQWLEAM
ncbi:MAG: hypothetical protein RMX68_024405 [Aulosira sp. ZfuVER01]|nr:hypothetical protein [Aulosira sp. ZfuVER01]MDZ8000528.1 hypothetical protein [Aulosira sp. DedVER01a]MDZ8056329.1 hypothetical protein [Aulosira sp. ZfuCHP01]